MLLSVTFRRSCTSKLQCSWKPFESSIRQKNMVPVHSFSTIIPFKLADIGEGIAEVELMKWFVKEGDQVKSFDRICEVQSDKATVEITSRYDGKITKVHYPEGAIVNVGSALVDIQTLDTGSQPNAITEKQPEAHTAAKSGSPVLKSSDKADVSSDKVLTTPAVRKIAKENKIDLGTVQGTGPRGRIIKEDILNHISNGSGSASATRSSPVASNDVSESKPMAISPPPLLQAAACDKKVPIRGIQRLMVKSMNSANQVKHLTLGEEILCDRLVSLRKNLKSLGKKQHVKISYMPIIIKATSLALMQFPMLNATVNEDASEMTYHSNHNIGVAMDTPKGLIVPVIRQVQNKSILEIAQELNMLQEAATKGQITEAQLSGGTFSLSNIGSIGGTYAVPVLVMPQVCIGAIGRLMNVPRYLSADGDADVSIEDIESGKASVKPVLIMNISWSADHRVVDGATVARFSNAWKSYLESPETILASMR